MIATFSPRGRLDPFDRAFVALIAALTVGSVALLAAPNLSIRVVAPALDLSLDTVALVVTSLVAGLAWIRFRERHEPIALYQAAAFIAIAIADASAVVMTVVLQSDSTLTTVEPGQDQLIVFAAARLLAAALLAVGASRSLAHASEPEPVLVILGSALAVVGVLAVVGLHVPLPPLVIAPSASRAAPTMTGLGVGVQVGAALLFGAAAWRTREVWRRDGAIGDRYIALGLVVAAFAQIHGAAFPTTHPGPVSTADLLRLVFDVVLLLAIEAEARVLLASLRRANLTLQELRDGEADRAALEERTRLSRELHDGLAQALWLAKLKIARLQAIPDLPPDAATAASDAADAVEVGLSEARQAVMALRIAADTKGSLSALLGHYLEEHADRFGLRIRFEADPDLPVLPARTQAELLRIAQEALSNVRRHANATSVTVRVGSSGNYVRLSVVDNGVGFDTGAPRLTRFGLAAMEERAVLIGGRLAVRSMPGDGTEIIVLAPIGGVSPGAGGSVR